MLLIDAVDNTYVVPINA
jgi:hypothetical protein